MGLFIGSPYLFSSSDFSEQFHYRKVDGTMQVENELSAARCSGEK